MDSPLLEASGLQFNNVVFHHIPNGQAPGVLAAMLVFTFCFGIITLEILTNLRHDFRLVFKPGWSDIRTCINRTSYLLCRYLCFIFLLISIIYMNLPGSNCKQYAVAINVLFALPLVMVDMIFIQRTLAVYNWNRSLIVLLGTLFTTYVGLCFYSILNFGFGYRIPFSDFCTYQTNPTTQQPHGTLFIIYIVFIVLLDTLILLLTAHRVIEGGLPNVLNLLLTKTEKVEEDKVQKDVESLSTLLLRQGVGYFLCLQLSRLVFLVVYYTVNNNTAYQILIAGILVTFGPVMAGMLFRQTSQAVQRTANLSNHGRGGFDQGVLSQGKSYRSSAGNFTKSLSLNRNLVVVTNDHSTTGLVNGSPPLKSESTGHGTAGNNSPSMLISQLPIIQHDPDKQLEIFVEEQNDVHSMYITPVGRKYDPSALEEGLPIHRQYSSGGRIYRQHQVEDEEEDGGYRFNATPSTQSHSTNRTGSHRRYSSNNVKSVPGAPDQYNRRIQ